MPANLASNRPSRLWHVDGTISSAATSDLRKRPLHDDMQKIMLAVLTAMQEEQQRAQERAAEQTEHADQRVTGADRE